MMSAHDNREKDAATNTDTTGHEWDGIKELDTPLPRWWLYLFYACIAVAVVYWVLMPSWPLLNSYTKGALGHSDRKIVVTELQRLHQARAADFQRLQSVTFDEAIADPDLRQFGFAAGETAFNDNCRTCHGAGGGGLKGYPSLADNVWLWGGTPEDIEHTLRVGIRSTHPDTRMSQMPAYGRDGLLTEPEIGNLTEYVLSISAASKRIKPNIQAAAAGAPLFAQQCVSCHGVSGEGNRAFGAPSLRDDIWLYGGTREEIRTQIEQGRGGVMPSWQSRFDPATIRALAIYVYALGGGEKTPPPLPAPVTPATDAASTAAAAAQKTN
jgi:cytochrome c oxidase cbb3-type subunit 3